MNRGSHTRIGEHFLLHPFLSTIVQIFLIVVDFICFYTWREQNEIISAIMGNVSNDVVP